MGFSLLSGAELIYFFTLRLYVDMQREKEEKRKGKEGGKEPDQETKVSKLSLQEKLDLATEEY